MTPLPPSPPTAPLPAPPMTSGVAGRWIFMAVFLVATAAAFAVVIATHDDTLGQKQRRARAQIRRLENYFVAFHRSVGRYPTQAEGFAPLIEAQVLDKAPEDPWGRPYVYQVRGSQGFVLSYGSDGVPGGSGEASDVSSGGIEELKQ